LVLEINNLYVYSFNRKIINTFMIIILYFLVIGTASFHYVITYKKETVISHDIKNRMIKNAKKIKKYSIIN